MKINKISERKGFRFPFFASGAIAAIVTAIALSIVTIRFDVSQKDVLTFSSAVSGLSHFSEIYATADDLRYYNQGDLAFAFAAKTTDAVEIEKYRRFIQVTLDHAPRMMDSSRCVLYYNLGKIDLLLKDKEKAIIDFRRAYDLAPSLVKSRLDVDESIKQYFISNALMK